MGSGFWIRFFDYDTDDGLIVQSIYKCQRSINLISSTTHQLISLLRIQIRKSCVFGHYYHSQKGITPITQVLAVDPKYFRPTKVDLFIGDPTKAKTKLGWECKYDFQALVNALMQSDLKLMQSSTVSLRWRVYYFELF